MKMIQRLLLVLCALGLAVSGVGMTLAYPNSGRPTLVYDGQARTLTILNATETDLFAGLKDLMPGDTATQQIDLQARNLRGPAALYLRAECADETAQALAPLTLTVSANGRQVDSGPAGGSEALQKGVLLYQFQDDATVPLQVQLQVPVTVGNELAAAQHSLQWIFTLQAQGDNGQGGEENGGDGGVTGGQNAGGNAAPAPGATPDATATTAATGAVQLVPQTGDSAPLGAWQAAFAVSAAGLLLVLLAGRRKSKKESE